MHPAETPEFWASYSKEDLIGRVAALHAQRRELSGKLGEAEVRGARTAIARVYLQGNGIEVGAGDRPFPMPDGVQCYYGDIRDRQGLTKYFGNDLAPLSGFIDAQTFAGVQLASLDFVIAAHVIEHLHDPINAIAAAVATLKPGGIFVCVVPEKEKNWDRDRPPTTLEHLLIDSRDGGKSTLFQAHVEQARYAHPILEGEQIPESEIENHARKTMEKGADIHIHCWRASEFTELLATLAPMNNFTVEVHVPVVNENIYVMRGR